MHAQTQRCRVQVVHGYRSLKLSEYVMCGRPTTNVLYDSITRILTNQWQISDQAQAQQF